MTELPILTRRTGPPPSEAISVFDMIKIGIGPSSSHTMGPWRAATSALAKLHGQPVAHVAVDLYGSLAKTGAGHGTDVAVLLGLTGADYLTVDVDSMMATVAEIKASGHLALGGGERVPVVLRFRDTALPFHPNGLTFTFTLADGHQVEDTYYSIGGGFVVQEDAAPEAGASVRLPYPIETAGDLRRHCRETGQSVAGVVWRNEQTWRSPVEIDYRLGQVWYAMKAAVWRGCHTPGELPGGLQVKRRAPEMARKLLGDQYPVEHNSWVDTLRTHTPSFQQTLKWLSCFAIAANEENAAFGRIVTAPTNGASGVIPAVLHYYTCFVETESALRDVRQFLLTAGEIGSLFKKGATISAAMGGCQAEIGVSSAMAAAGLTECLGGSVDQVLMAAEIAMEHHLGLTCDPIGGLVQIPCIERNAMGAVKAITAANVALDSDPQAAKVSLDACIKSMWETALDMNTKYKETSEGGLAVNLSVGLAEC